ncbi:DUF4258 domain-containing protein [Spirosoma utsteinense]
MTCTKITYKLHAVEQMFNRAITQEEVEHVIKHGEAIAAYPMAKPYPSLLHFAFVDARPIHIVIAQSSDGECYL